MIAIHFAEV